MNLIELHEGMFLERVFDVTCENCLEEGLFQGLQGGLQKVKETIKSHIVNFANKIPGSTFKRALLVALLTSSIFSGAARGDITVEELQVASKHPEIYKEWVAGLTATMTQTQKNLDKMASLLNPDLARSNPEQFAQQVAKLLKADMSEEQAKAAVAKSFFARGVSLDQAEQTMEQIKSDSQAAASQYQQVEARFKERIKQAMEKESRHGFEYPVQQKTTIGKM